MKKILTVLLFATLALSAFAQETRKSEQRRLDKQLKKEQQAEKLVKIALDVEVMVTQHRFVLEANSLMNRKGTLRQVSSNLNFVSSDSTTGILQVGFDASGGTNGVGGNTVQGEIVDYKYSKHEKNGSYKVTYTLRSTVGDYNVYMTAFPDSRAEASISHVSWTGRFTFSGYLVHPDLSSVYKGHSLYTSF